MRGRDEIMMRAFTDAVRERMARKGRDETRMRAFADAVRDRMARNEERNDAAIGELRARPREIVVPAAEVRNEGPQVTVQNRVDVPSVSVQNHVDVPSVSVHNRIDSPVTVDAGPLAEAMLAVAAAVDRQTACMDRLLEALAVQPRPRVKVEVAPELKLDEAAMGALADRLAAALAEAREDAPARRLTVEHSDGTISTITENNTNQRR